MCIPRVTPISATLVFNNLSKLTKFKPSPNTRMQLNKQPLRDFSAMKCGPRGQEVKSSNSNNQSVENIGRDKGRGSRDYPPFSIHQRKPYQ